MTGRHLRRLDEIWVTNPMYCRRRLGFMMPLWQPEYFDHVLRSSESYEEKWEYVCNNPIRAGLAESVDEWKHQGEFTQLRGD